MNSKKTPSGEIKMTHRVPAAGIFEVLPLKKVHVDFSMRAILGCNQEKSSS